MHLGMTTEGPLSARQPVVTPKSFKAVNS